MICAYKWNALWASQGPDFDSGPIYGHWHSWTFTQQSFVATTQSTFNMDKKFKTFVLENIKPHLKVCAKKNMNALMLGDPKPHYLRHLHG